MDDDAGTPAEFGAGSGAPSPPPSRDEVLDALGNQLGVVLDNAGRVVAITPAAHAMLGGKLRVGIDFVDLVAPDDRQLALALLTGSPLDSDLVTLRCAHHDGSLRALECRSRNASDGELVICAEDVTERERARAELAFHDALIDMLHRGANLTTVFDAATTLAETGAPGTRAALYRIRDENMELLSAGDVSSPFARATVRVPVPDGLVGGLTVAPATGRLAELGGEHGHGFGWTVLGSAAPNVALCVFVGAKRFLTASERVALTRAADLAATALTMHDELVQADDRAATDSLTGVLSRHAFFDALDVASRPVTLMLVHVGGITAVNAAHGYDAGDATLRAVALALQGVVRRRDIVGRLSGATFAIAGPSRSANQDVERWADRVREAVRTRLVAAGRVLEPACRVTHVIGPAGLRAADILLQAEAQLRGAVTGLGDARTDATVRGGDAGSGRRPQDR
jgi:diguanylate cyclase (GGDEF)-like protein